MKNVSLIALGVTAPLAFGLTTTKTYIDSYRGRTDIPVPVKMVAPDADSSQAGARVEVEFVADATGKPQNVHVLSATDHTFGVTVRDAVAPVEVRAGQTERHSGANDGLVARDRHGVGVRSVPRIALRRSEVRKQRRPPPARGAALDVFY